MVETVSGPRAERNRNQIPAKRQQQVFHRENVRFESGLQDDQGEGDHEADNGSADGGKTGDDGVDDAVSEAPPD